MEEAEDNDLDYHLNDPKEIEQQILNNNRKKNIILGIAIFLIILFVVAIVIYVIKFIIGNKDGNEDNKNRIKESNFTSQFNISYGEDKIENTFKLNCSNYKEELKEINGGKDYGRNPNRNKYDLFIPKNLNKTQYNKILLFIHGGAWVRGDKSDLNPLCKNFANNGYITASMAHTFLNDTNNNSSIFRILDEVASVIKNIKKNLKDKGFNETKLELAIGGYSSGAHIALLYAYSYKNSPIKIKFVINILAPVTLESKYYYKIKNSNVTLDDIEEETLNKYIKENKVEPMNNSLALTKYMNLFLGNKENDNITEMLKDPEKKEIDTDNQKYKDLLKRAKFGFPTYYVDINTVPTICLYTGKDITIGIKHYSYLKSMFEKKGNDKIELIYLKSLPHYIYLNTTHPEFLDGISQLSIKIFEYSNKYFTQNNI